MSMSSSIALDLGVQQHRGCTSRVLHKKQRKNKPGANKKNKPENRKQKNKEKQRNKQTWKNPGFDLFLFFFLWWFFQSVCFFCGEPVFDYVVNVFLLVVFFFATINLLCSRWPQNVKQQVHWFVIFAICSMKNMPVLHVSWMSVMFP